MIDKSPPDEPAHNQPEYSVSELSTALKRTVEGAFGHVRVRGEISGFKRAASGHLYMALKDESAVLDAVCWRGLAGNLAIRPEDGMEVIVSGRLTTYAARSRYQIVIESMELAGEGALLKLLEARRKALAAEGLFDAARKRPLPYLPDIIGIVTSPTGAVIRDILHRLDDRFPRHVLLWPVLVQGEAAAAQIADAIAGFNRIGPDDSVPRPDLLIVARGGGSLEDLWAFNEEAVVRAAAASEIPLISAVGHETDTTLIDFAADLRAPTPTAAAELAVPVRAEIQAALMDSGRRLLAAATRLIEERRLRVEGLGRGVPEPRALLETAMQRLDDWSERLRNGVMGMIAERRHRLDGLARGLAPTALRGELTRGRQRLDGLADRLPAAITRRLDDTENALAARAALIESYSYKRTLERGFVLVRDAAGQPVLTAKATRPGMAARLQFADAEVGAMISGGKPRRRRRPSDDEQGSLL